MSAVAGRGLVLLISDVVFGAALWGAVLQLNGASCCLNLGTVWAVGGVKWVLLRVLTSTLTDGRVPASLRRLEAVLCLLSPVMESGRVLMASRPPGPDLAALLPAPVAAALACAVWEVGFCGDGEPRGVKVEADGRRLLLRMLRHFREDSAHLAAAFTALLLGVLCDSFIPLYQGRVVDMLRGQRLHQSYGAALGRLLLLYLGSALCSGVRGGVFKLTLSRLNRRLKLQLFQRLLQQEAHFFEEIDTGEAGVRQRPSPTEPKAKRLGTLCDRLHPGVDDMGRTVALNANAVARSAAKTLVMVALMLRLSWELTLLCCVETLLHAAVQKKYSHICRELKKQKLGCQGRTKDLATQILGGVQTVRSFKAEEAELRRYRRVAAEMSAIKRRSGISGAVVCLIRRVVTVALRAPMLVRARSLVLSGQLSVGGVVSFLMYHKPMLLSMKEILYSLGDTLSTVGVLSDVFSYVDRAPRCRPAGRLAPEKLGGGVVFRDVTFCYPSAPDRPALKAVSVELRAGEVTALVGPSGSGKTSFISLLKRLYEPQGGQILLDGEELHRYNHKYLHQKVAVVSQNAELFAGSRSYNITYGLASCTPQEVMAAAQKINALDLLSNMEDERDSDVGEGGANLSESQRKRVAVLRALVREPRVILLDEATAGLDVDAQHAVLQQVVSGGRTVLLVSHQLEMVEKAHHIIYMENGAVVEEGTHQELMAKRGRYYHQKEQLFARGD